MPSRGKQIAFSEDVAGEFYKYKQAKKESYLKNGSDPVSIDNNATMLSLLSYVSDTELKKENAELKKNMLSMLEDREKIRDFLQKINTSNGQRLIVDIDKIPGLSNEFINGN